MDAGSQSEESRWGWCGAIPADGELMALAELVAETRPSG